MNPLDMRKAAPLLCLLLACAQPREPPATADGAGASPRWGLSALTDAGGTWSEKIEMNFGRSHHTATLLLDGKVLITGGVVPTINDTVIYSINDAELYNPATGSSSSVGKSQYRFGHTATLLRDGKVLVAGGFADRAPLHSAEIYNPNCAAPPDGGSPAFGVGATCTPWTPIKRMNHPRAAHTATLLRDGRVLMVGGVSLSLLNPFAVPPPEVYDPATGEWTDVARPADENRAFHTATLLEDGKVLVLGGVQFLMSAPADTGYTPFTVLLNGQKFITFDAKVLDSAEVYTPELGTWTRQGSGPALQRAAHTATLMPDGKVLVIGGWKKAADSTRVELEIAGMTATGMTALDSAEVYEPSSGRSAPAGSGPSGRAFHTATLLPDGRVLLTGGRSVGTSTPLDTTWVYDPNQSETHRWSGAAGLPLGGRALHTATLLPGGRVLVTGGYKSGHFVHSTFFLYDANTGVWSSAGNMGEPRREFTATPLPDGRVLVLGGTGQPADGGTPLRSAEFYAGDGSWPAAPADSLCEARRGHTATLLPDGTVLVAGGFSDDGSPLGSAELYDPASSPPGCTRIEDQNPVPRGAHTATLLPTGRVLIAGGSGRKEDGRLFALQSSLEYDIDKKEWISGSDRDIHFSSLNHTATLLPDGKVLLAGGRTDTDVGLVSSLYDPFVRDWIPAETTDKKPNQRRYSHTATLLPDGRVLVAGGYNELKEPSSDSEWYAPTSQTWTRSSDRMSEARAQHAAILLPTGQVLVTGGYNKDGAPLASAELYEPGTDSWSPAPPLREARAEHAMVALPDGSLLVLGGTGVSGVLSSAELYTVPAGNLDLRPLITRLESHNDSSATFFDPGVPLTVTGERFRGGSEASGGGTNSSAVDFPLLRLRSFETGQWLTPPGQSFSDSSVTVPLPPRLLDGHYLLNVTSSGQTTSKVILLRNLAPPDTFFTSPSSLPRDEPAKNVSFQFSSDAGDVHSYECSLDGADFEPCTSPCSVSNLDFGDRTFEVRARDLANHVDPTPARHTWRRARLSHYGFNCSAGDGSLWQAGPWALLLLGLRRRRRARAGG